MIDKEAVKAFGKIVAVYAEIEGMKAENMCAQTMGSLSLPYGETPFFQMSDKIKEIVKEIGCSK